ncbi:GNAT family N-acetyltransferase [Streptomyces sp. NPDC003077]|uniref:GNAT family N-acetyltransferase n=1 Tax=Streptomyces sp. NPDC003077 TaxID=3154443 RepID=UPI0033B3AE70
MTTELRTLRPEQWDHWYGRLERAFGAVVESPEERGLYEELTETERSLALWDGDECVGTAGAFSFRMTVPGGALVPTAGVTMVSVQSTHRRRGLLRQMMRRQLTDVRERNEPLAVLTASEPAIYGRFGYGAATEAISVTVDTTRVTLATPEIKEPGTLPDGHGADGGRPAHHVDEVRMRLVTPEEGLEACERVYARLVPRRPGMLARQPGWEREPILDPESERHGAGVLLCVLAEVDGEPRGYARYAIKSDWGPGGADGTVLVRDVEALDPVVYAALWRYLAGIDLTTKVFVRNLPADDPVLHLVSDIRRCQVGVRESMFVRTVDVGAALAARTYATPVDVVLDVTDPFCPWNEGRWRLSGDGKGAVCERTSDPAELTLSARDLGSVYLGGYALTALAAAGRVREVRQGALREASVAFGSDVKPWLPHGF